MSESLKTLLSLEKTGKYVFHGSPAILDSLEPIQAYNYESGIAVKHGEPAVCATQFVKIAIFRSLINKANFNGNSTTGFGINNGELHFSSTKNLLEVAEGLKGKVYVLERGGFSEFGGMEYRSFNSQKPIQIIEVSFEDLPENIRIIQ